jgi:hypothetical protein
LFCLFKIGTVLAPINDATGFNENTDGTFLRPPISSRLTTPRKQQVTSVGNTLKPSKDMRKSVAFSNSKNDQKRFTSPTPKSLSTTKKQQPHWEASNVNTSTYKRPSSGMSQLTSSPQIPLNDDNVSNENTNKSALFLNYAKLVAIESNMHKELAKDYEQINNTRPKTANPLFQTQKDAIGERKITGLDLIENKTLSIGNQEAYAYLMADNKKYQQLESIKYEHLTNSSSASSQLVDWLTLPHEIWLNILSFLKHTDLIQFGRCCKSFSNIYLDNTLCKFNIK